MKTFPGNRGHLLDPLTPLFLAALLLLGAPLAAQPQEGDGCTAGECHRDKSGAAFTHLTSPGHTCRHCHEGDSSRHPAGEGREFLPAAGGVPALCLRCHPPPGEGAGCSGHPDLQGGGCPACHDPHGSAFKFLLRKGQVTLCLDCHPRVAERLSAAKVPHPAMRQVTCTGCHGHNPTGRAGFLRSPSRRLCFGCHKDKGSWIGSMPNLHRPVAEDRCAACHEPHGSERLKLLKMYFPQEYYIEFKVENYNLCWQCHPREMVLAERSSTMTAFRNGGTNLHFVHVNKKKGRSCKACHEVHATRHAGGIRTQIEECFLPRGELKVRFTMTSDGGSCLTACHKDRAYSRERPFTY